MKERPEEVHTAWLDRLDEIVEGVDTPSQDDDELLRLAGRLNVALAPLRELDAPARAHRQRLRTQLRAQLSQQASRRKWFFRPLFVAAALLIFVVLGPGIVFELNPLGVQNIHVNRQEQGWAPADLPSVNTYRIASPADIHGIALLLPTNLAGDAYLVALNTSAYGSRKVLKAYLVYEQDALIYETPSSALPSAAYSSATYQTVFIGDVPAYVSRTRDGQNLIEWYQYGLLCDLVGRQSEEEMVAMVQALKVVIY